MVSFQLPQPIPVPRVTEKLQTLALSVTGPPLLIADAGAGSFELEYRQDGKTLPFYCGLGLVRGARENHRERVLIKSMGIDFFSIPAGYGGVEFCPALNPFYWGENSTNARLLYRLAKQFFEVFECDEMVGSSDHYEGAFHFIRGAPQQRVLTYAEEDRLPTEQEIEDDTWYAWWPTERVFPTMKVCRKGAGGDS